MYPGLVFQVKSRIIPYLYPMKKLVIFGCGRLARIVVNAVLNDLLPEYDLVGVYSRTAAKADEFAAVMTQHGRPCKAYSTLEELLALRPDYLVEAASPAAMKSLTLPALMNGTSIVTLSIGALADTVFYKEAIETAKKNGTRIYIASGATGGFDVLRTATLMGNAKACFFNEKGVNALRRSSVYDPVMEKEKRIVFSGTALEAIGVFPTGLNVSVAASLASVGPEDMQVTMQSTPGFVGDTQRVEIKNDQVHAMVDVYSATSDIAGWSVVSTLINIVSPVVF
jgi:aspartate dehydrogenase